MFESNTVSGSGGGFYGGSCDNVALEDATFRSNRATWGGKTRGDLVVGRMYDASGARHALRGRFEMTTSCPSMTSTLVFARLQVQ